MCRTAILLIFCGLVIAPQSFSQQSTPQTPEDAYTSRELIAWSQLQNPQPTPQPLPPRDTPVPQPQQPQDQQSKLPADPQTQQEPTHSYSGRVLKDADGYVLKTTESTTLLLDASIDLRQYQDRNVRIVGNFDPVSHSMRVVKIELLS